MARKAKTTKKPVKKMTKAEIAAKFRELDAISRKLAKGMRF